ncbi:post-GPI attachment to proteins factor 2-like [Diadema setosum]|uniref:post-GPI attachment to proteins factor 2-like n=1 Tax=Diadema setosum TaxID=31175 RepID=UPI003B3A969D
MDIGGRFSSNGVVVTFRSASLVTTAIMLVGFLTSVVCAVVFNFKSTTSTHCGVDNYLPSISAAIAKPPSSYIWRLSITLCASQRLFTIVCHYAMYTSIPLNRCQYQWLINLSTAFELIENLSLIGLTCVSSVENHHIHEICFVVFQASSMLFMLVMCMLHNLALNQGTAPTRTEYRSFMRQVSFFVTNVVAFTTALYFYYRHNQYCEPGVYTIFAFLEYVVVLSNIGFHFMVTSNFGDRVIKFGVWEKVQF